MKQCTLCKKFLPLTKFFLRGDSDKLRSQCKDCTNTNNLKRYHKGDKTNRSKVTYKYNLKTNYDLSVEAYNQLYLSQNGKCCICELPLSNRFLGTGGIAGAMDHSHVTGKNRNILCTSCNKGLGNFKDNPFLLDKAKVYLENHSS